MVKIKLKELLRKYQDGSITPEEEALLEQWYLQSQPAHQPLDEAHLAAARAEVWDRMTGPKPLRLWPRFAAAAAILLMIGAYGYFLLRDTNSTTLNQQAKLISPGTNKAILTLSGGRKISLTDARNGELVKTGGVTVTKNDSGQVAYAADRNTKITYNDLATPKGGQWHIVLADGTGVWLNAASTLHYPTAFNGPERTVELNGEAYFEVAKDKAHPFIVATANQKVTVLGTHFNISSYTDDATVQTTLLEGAVKVTAAEKTTILKPGQQATLIMGRFDVQEIDLDDAIGWKNGKFVSDNENIRSVMRKIARWYNVEVVYQSLPETDSFSGSISRFASLQQVLSKIALTNKVHFTITGRRVTVSR